MAQIVGEHLEDLGVIVGLTFVQGVGLRVATRSDASGERHMSAAAARRLADELTRDATTAEELAPVAKALRNAADRLDEIGLTDLANIEMQGNA